MPVTFPHIFVFMALLPASTKPRRPGFEMLSPRVFDGSSMMTPTWFIASLRATSLGCKGSQELIKRVARTILVGPHGRVMTTTLGGAAATTIGAVA